MNCPKAHGNMPLKKLWKTMKFREVDIEYMMEAHVCPLCKLEAGTIKQTGAVQKAIADAYRRKMNMLTSDELCDLRKQAGMTQQELAEKIGVTITDIKNWETGMIQSMTMDNLLKQYLQYHTALISHLDEQEFSISYEG